MINEPANGDVLKSSFEAIYDIDTEILILGTLPGEKSLSMSEYYANPRNRFWRVLADLTNSKMPENYQQKVQMLLLNKIGVWDVVKSAERVGSLDTNIVNEIPNDLESLFGNLPNLKTIAYNGAKAQSLFKKYFTPKANLEYFILPSTSPANASFNLERLLEKWRVIFK